MLARVAAATTGTAEAMAFLIKLYPAALTLRDDAHEMPADLALKREANAYASYEAFFKALAEAGADKEWLLLATAVSGDPKQLPAAQWLVEKQAATGVVDCEGRQVSQRSLLCHP